MNTYRLRRGFTLMEVLIVVGIIALLVAMLMPAVNRARAQARIAVCASNLHQIHGLGQAWSLTNSQDFTYAGWSATITQAGGKGVLVCPESDLNAEAPVIADLYQFAANLVVHINNTNWDIPCVPGPWARLENPTASSFVLSFEDQGSTGGGDFSYNNVKLQFTDNGDGTITVTILPSGGGYTSDLRDTTGKTIMTNVGQSAGAVNVGKAKVVPAAGGTTNYGMSTQAHLVFGNSDKIYAMDYYASATIDLSDDWNSSMFPRSVDGTLVFARHRGMVNVLFGDGSVRLNRISGTELNPPAIGPGGISNRKVYWEPN